MRALAALCVAAFGLSACQPGLPAGVDKAKLDEGVSRAIGDAATCMLIAERDSGKIVYRYNTHTVCARTLPACDHPGRETLEDFLKATAKDGQPRTRSCTIPEDASRGVGWASGVITDKGLVYAAVMEGKRSLPGLIMADKLERPLRNAGL